MQGRKTLMIVPFAWELINEKITRFNGRVESGSTLPYYPF
jgi:hypothetical protein